MVSIGSSNQQAANLYWLAFLLTGNREASVDAAAETIAASEASPFFLAWMLTWSRKVVIAKALAAIRQELAVSARRVAVARSPRGVRLPPNWTLSDAAGKVELERALLAIDAFPRCVLLLLLFEGLSMEDAAVLLDADRELIRKAQAFAVEELAGYLAAA
jgi:DNA-directed RNA polymerase specialized sigma24 family protein